MIRTRHRHLAVLAAVVAMAFAAQASAQSLLVLSYSQAKAFGNVHISGGAIDLTQGAMIVTTSSFGFVPSGGQNNEYGSPGVPEYGDKAIHDAIVEGSNFASGYYNGSNGIFSSAAANDSNSVTAVGWVDNSVSMYTTFEGIPVTTDQSIIATTWVGDALLQGVVTTDDFAAWLATYTNPAGANVSANTGGPVEWYDGNNTLTSTVTTDDFAGWLAGYTSPYTYNRNFNASSIATPLATSPAAVPEPASLLLLLAMLPLMFSSRLFRRRK